MVKIMKIRFHWIIVTVFVCVVSITLSLYWNSLLSEIINCIDIGSSINISTLISASAVILTSALAGLTLSLLSGWTCELITHDIRMDYAKRFITLPIHYIENINSGDYVSKLQNEISEISSYLNSNLFPIIEDFIRFAATLAWLLWLNPKLTILSNFPILLILWYVSLSGKIIQKAAHKSQQANSSMNIVIDTLINIFPIIRIFDASNLLIDKYNTELKAWEKLSIKEERTRAALMSLSAVISFTPLALLFLFGGSQVINGEISLGNFYVFLNLSGNLSGVMNNMPNRTAAFRRFLANLKRLDTK